MKKLVGVYVGNGDLLHVFTSVLEAVKYVENGDIKNFIIKDVEVKEVNKNVIR